MSIRSFFKPVDNPAKKRDAGDEVGPASKRAKEAVPAAKAVSGPSEAELKRAKQVVAAAKKKKKAEAEAAFVISDELLDWAKRDVVYRELHALSTNFLKGHCQDNGLRFGGPKYELVQRLSEHAVEGLRRDKWRAASAAAEEGDASAAAEALFFSVKSFGAALNLFKKQHAKLGKVPSVRQRIQTMAGLSTGFDAALLKAITGPDAKKYNGGRGEIGIDGQQDVADLWGEFLLGAVSGAMTLDDWRLACDAVWLRRPTAAYGFDGYGDLIRSDSALQEAINRSAEFKAAWEQR